MIQMIVKTVKMIMIHKTIKISLSIRAVTSSLSPWYDMQEFTAVSSLSDLDNSIDQII